MAEPEPAPHRRRPRYRGTHPQRFHEKYKELQPELYPGEAAKVIEGGDTPAGTHRPILVAEVLAALAPKPGDIAMDCTLGHGGHARELLAAVSPAGRLLGIDVDPLELPRTEARLRGLGFPAEALVVRRLNFAGAADLIAAEAPGGVDALLADLGLSSMQLDNPARGFTYKDDGPLDMRMNPSRGMSAADLLAKLDRSKLAALLAENADEPLAEEMAAAIKAAHAAGRLTSTGALAEAARAAWDRAWGGESTGDPRGGASGGDERERTVRRVFQAVRIAVNDEFGALDTFLRRLPECLRPGGRVAVLTFHSGEDRRVKAAFKQGLREGVYTLIAEEVVRASPAERRANPRSAAAKLRFAVRGDG